MEQTLIECLDCHVIFSGNENHSCRNFKILCGRYKQGLFNRYVKGNGASTSNVQYVSGALTVDCNILTDNSVKHAESLWHTEDLNSDDAFVNVIPNSLNVKFVEWKHSNQQNTSQKHFGNQNSFRENSAYIYPIEQHSIALQTRDLGKSYLGSPVSAHPNISKLNKEIVSTTSKNPASAPKMESGFTKSEYKKPHVYNPKHASILQAHNEQPSNESRNETKLLASTIDTNLVSRTSGMYFETQYRIENGRYICLLCEKSYSVKVNFVVHFRTHSGEKPYVCDECGKGYTQKSNLNTHILTHTGEKRYVCNECGKRFAHKYTLDQHLLTHTGEKPFVCNECGIGFAQKSTLYNHLLTHSEQKPYVCNWCQKGYSRKDRLLKNMQIHAGE